MTKELADGSAEGEDDFAKGHAAVSKMKTTPVDAGAKAERASKDEKLRAGIASANALGQPRSSDDP